MSQSGNRGENQSGNAHFWNQLLNIIEQIESGGPEQCPDDIAAMLLGLSEGFDALADPVETFEEYAVIRLSRALHDALYSNPVCKQKR